MSGTPNTVSELDVIGQKIKRKLQEYNLNKTKVKKKNDINKAIIDMVSTLSKSENISLTQVTNNMEKTLGRRLNEIERKKLRMTMNKFKHLKAKKKKDDLMEKKKKNQQIHLAKEDTTSYDYKEDEIECETFSEARMYIGHLPYGFKETQLYSFFSQFGDINKIQLPRSKTGNVKGYCWITFKISEVAEIVASTMNGSIMFDKKLVCSVENADEMRKKRRTQRSSRFNVETEKMPLQWEPPVEQVNDGEFVDLSDRFKNKYGTCDVDTVEQKNQRKQRICPINILCQTR